MASHPEALRRRVLQPLFALATLASFTLAPALLAITLFGAFGAGEAHAQLYGANKPRAKIDKVEVDEAPYIKIYTTFLNSRGLPVSPEQIGKASVTCDDVPVDSDVDVSTYFEQEEEFMDIAVVIPVSKRFSDKEQEQIKAGVSEIIGLTREQDRVAAFIDQGLGIDSSGLGAADAAAEKVSSVESQGTGAFLYSGLDRALTALIKEGEEERKRVIVLVTDGFDTNTLDPRAIGEQVVNIYQRAEKENIKIFVVMYKPIFEDIVPLFEGLSRKTGATFRQAVTPSGIVRNVEYAYGEFYGQLVLDFKMSDVKVGDSCTFQVNLERTSGKAIITKPFSEVEFTVVNTDWLGIAILAGIIAGVLLLLLIIFLIVRKVRKKRKAKREAEEREAQQAAAMQAGGAGAGAAAGAGAGGAMGAGAGGGMAAGGPGGGMAAGPGGGGMAAGPGGGGMAAGPGGGGMAGGPGGGGMAAGGRGGAGMAGGPGGGGMAGGAGGAGMAGGAGGGGGGGGGGRSSRRRKKKSGKTCDSCGRQMMPNWTECLFCKAGVGTADK